MSTANTSRELAAAAVSSPSPTNGGSLPLLGRFAGMVIRHRRRVVLIWLAAFLAGGFAASHLSSRLSYDFSLPGQPAYETGLKILHLYGNGGTTTPSIAVVTLPNDETVFGQEARLAAAFGSVRRANPKV